MRTGRLVLMMLLLGGAWLPTRGAEVAAHIPADTILVGRLDLAAIRDSDLASRIIEQHLEAYNTVCHAFTTNLGIDLNNVRKAWLLSRRPRTGVLVCEGHFQPMAVRAACSGLPEVTELARQGCAYVVRFRDPKKPGMQLGAVVDEQTLAVGDEASVDRFLRALVGEVAALAPDHPKLTRLKADTSVLAATLLGDVREWSDFDPQLARVVDAVWLRGDISDDLELRVELLAQTADLAEGLRNFAQGLAQLKANAPETAGKPMIRSLLQALEVNLDDRTVAIIARVSGSDIERRLASRW